MNDNLIQHEFAEYDETHIFLRLQPFDNRAEAELMRILEELSRDGDIEDYAVFVRDRDPQYYNYASKMVFYSSCIIRLKGDAEAFKNRVQESFSLDAPTLQRCTSQDEYSGIYRDDWGDFRQKFILNASHGVQRTAAAFFAGQFTNKVKNSDAVMWDGPPAQPTAFKVKVGYAQAFEDAFLEKFDAGM
ncbi:MAG: hypothetical protein AAF204_04725 [Pseudomonadota bacterium]